MRLFAVFVVLVACSKTEPEEAQRRSSRFTITLPMTEACADASACAAACDAGSAEQCRLLGNGTTDPARATALLERACDLGDAIGCVGAGRLFEKRGEDARAASLYDRACKKDDMTGCYNFGLMLEAGKGVARDEGRALELYTRVCAAGAQTACDAKARLQAR